MEQTRNPNGTFKNGHAGFKPKGSSNEFQKATREKLGAFLISKLDELPEVYEKLPDRDKAKMILSISEFFLPKQKEISMEVSPSEGADLSQWSDHDLRALLALHEKYQHDGN